MYLEDKAKIKSAFYLGYSLALIRGYISYLNSKQDALEELSVVINRSFGLIKEFEVDWRGLVGIDLPKCGVLKTNNEIEDYFVHCYEFLFEKVHVEGDSMTEISLLVGSIISLADTNAPYSFDVKQFGLITFELLNSLGVNLTWNDFITLINQLNSDDKCFRSSARNEIALLVMGESCDKMFNKNLFDIEQVVSGIYS